MRSSYGAYGEPVPAHRILIVHHDADEWMAVAALLRLNGHSVEHATSVDAALASSFDPEIVLLDLAMPIMCAIAAMRRLKAKYCPIKIVAVSGKAGAGPREKALRCGFDSYVTKPIRASVVEKLMARLVFETAEPPPFGALSASAMQG